MRTLPISLLTAAVSLAALASTATAQFRVRVTIENLAPNQATFQTPFWIGFHDGTFDTYDGGVPVFGPGALVPNDAIERLAEDGTTSILSTEFLASGTGVVDATLPGPNGPLAPGDSASGSFLIDPNALTSRYVSYASMVLPSNDAFVANGNPRAIEVFDANGNFVASSLFDSDVVDAGTEVNDEIPANTAFFGQMAPNTGVDENGVAMDHLGFLPRGSGGILDDPRFRQGDFTQPGYPVLNFRVEGAPAITERRVHLALLSGRSQVPPVNTNARGFAFARLVEDGTELSYSMFFRGLRDVTAAHLHIAPAGSNGPVVVDLLAGRTSLPRTLRVLSGEIADADLAGPLTAMPLDALSAAIENGEVYVNIHTEANPDGELRGQLTLLR